MIDDIAKRKDFLRSIIPRTKNGRIKTDRLETLDSMLFSRKFEFYELDFVEKEIRSHIEFFDTKKRIKENLDVGESAKSAST